MGINMPKAWLQAGVKKVEASAKVVARIDMSAEVAGAGLCPECKKPMERSFANGIDCFVCHPDRIAIPTADVEEVKEPSGVVPDSEQKAVLGPSTSESPVQ